MTIMLRPFSQLPPAICWISRLMAFAVDAATVDLPHAGATRRAPPSLPAINGGLSVFSLGDIGPLITARFGYRLVASAPA